MIRERKAQTAENQQKTHPYSLCIFAGITNKSMQLALVHLNIAAASE